MKGEVVAGLCAVIAIVFFITGAFVGRGVGGDIARQKAAKGGRFQIERAIYKCELVAVELPGGSSHPVAKPGQEPVVVPPKKDASDEERVAEFRKRLALLQLRLGACHEGFTELREEMEAMVREER